MLCRRHHRAVHEEGYQVERQADGELQFRRPDGRPLLDVPPPPAVPVDPVQALWAQNEAAGLHLHPRTATPAWLGERLDVGYAIDVLHPRALQPLTTKPPATTVEAVRHGREDATRKNIPTADDVSSRARHVTEPLASCVPGIREGRGRSVLSDVAEDDAVPLR
jgi:hypothetical protein